MPVNTAITFRKGSSSQWNSTNPVLASGEPGYDITNNILKIGDGVSNWNNLKNVASISGLITASSGNFNNLSVGGIPVSVSGHSHGNITSDGKIGNITSRIVTTSDNGLLVAETDVQFDCAAIFIGTSGDYINNGGMILAPGAIVFSDNTIQETAYTGKIGSTSGLLVVTTTDGSLTSSSGINSSLISNFNSSVSGLLPVTNILGGQNITISNSGTNYTVSVTGSLGLTTEEVDDRVSNLLVAGTGISLTYNDNLNTLIINTSGLQPSGNYAASSHTHTASQISDFNSSVSGLLPVKNILAGSGIAVSGNLGAYTVSVDIIDCGIIAPTSIFIPPTVAYYAFNANVTDANALYNGTAYGSPSFVSGYVGNAIELNSPSKYVTVPRSISTNWTISFFVKTASASPSSSNWYDGVNLLNGEMSGNVNDFGVVYLNNKVSVGIGNTDTTIFSSSTINNNVWRHVCTTRNSTTGQVKIYIDGILETTANMPTGAKSAASTLIIGGSVKYGSFNGLIDNMKIFDSVLTDAQISSLATGN